MVRLRAGGALPEALEHRGDHLVEGEALEQVLLGREAHLGVDDAVGGEVLGALLRDALERVLRLHHADGVVERLEVEHEVLAGGALGEPRGQLGLVGGGQAGVARLPRQLDHRGRPQTAVEVVVEEHLRRPAQLLERGGRPHRLTLPPRSRTGRLRRS